jgi:hypothetical protein
MTPGFEVGASYRENKCLGSRKATRHHCSIHDPELYQIITYDNGRATEKTYSARQFEDVG